MKRLLDFACASCNRELVDHFLASGDAHPSCCGQTMEVLWRQRSASVGFKIPVEFEDDDGTKHRFTSTEQIHRFERQTEREVACGLRRRPFVFREFSQSLSSNRDKNVFADRREQISPEELKRRTTRRGIDLVFLEARVRQFIPARDRPGVDRVLIETGGLQRLDRACHYWTPMRFR